MQLHITARNGTATPCAQSSTSLSASEIQYLFFFQPEHDGIIDDTACGIGDQHILALPHGHLAEVTRGEQLGKCCGIRTGNFNLPLHATSQRMASLTRSRNSVQDRQITRDIHVIIDRKILCAPFHGRIKIRRFAYLGAKSKIIRVAH